MADITGYITRDTSITGYVFDASIYGITASFAINGIPISYMYEYVDGSLALRDASIDWLNDNKVNNASLNFYELKVDADSSFGLYYTKTQIDASLNLYVTTTTLTTTLTDYLKEASLGSGLYWVNGLLDVSVAGGTGDVTKLYVDGSLAIRDSSIIDLYSKVGTGGVTQNYVDGSLALRDTSIAWLNTNKIGASSLNPYATNASIGTAAFAKNASLALYELATTLDTSFGLYYTKTQVDTSFGLYATNASIGTAAFAKNASLSSYSLTTHNHQGLYLKEASLGNSFLWNAGKVDVSLAGGGVTQSYVDTADNLIKATYIPDSSLNKSYFRWVSNLLEPSVATGGGDVTKLYVDGSLALRDTSIAWLNTNKLGLTALDPYATNASIGTAAFAKNASFNLYATNASIGTAAFVQGTPWTGMGYVTGTPWTALGYATITNVNASLNLFATNSSVGTAIASFATNSSVGLAIAPFATNASVGLAIQNFATNASINTAAFAKNASFNLYATNASIGLAGFENKADVDTSLNSIWTNFGLYATNASINTAGFENKLDVDTSFGMYATNASIGTAGFAKNASLALYELAINVDTSFGLYSTTTQTNTALGYRDTSILGIWTKLGNVDTSLNSIVGGSGVTQTYVDGSLALRDSSIIDLYSKVGSGGGGSSTLISLTDVSIIDVSNNDFLKYDSSISHWTNISPIEISSYCYSQTQSDVLYNPKRLVATLAASDVTSGTTENIMLQLAIPAARAVSGSTFRAWVVGNSSSTGTLIFKVRCGAGGTITDTIDWTAVTSATQVANATAGFEVIITVRSATTIAVRGVGYAGTVQLPTVVASPTTPAITISGNWYINLTVICSSGTFTAQVGLIEEII